MDEATAGLARRLAVACRAVGRAGLSHAYGHCSMRVSGADFIVSPAKALALVMDDDAPVRVDANGPLPSGALPEVRLHQQIYRSRADVAAIVRFQSPKLMSLSTMERVPHARHGLGSYFAPRPPLWTDPRLVRDDDKAKSVAATLGGGRAIVLRGNGAVVVGRSIEEAVVLAWYLEDAARVELDVLATGLMGRVLEPAEAADRAITSGRLFERMWDWLVAGDPSAAAMPPPSPP
ncbi:MAG TPA: class II aldolase/adducin family protein [Albitalea sp.]|uniref:class II aldolase/adducin family protein n=1 Tax=Piscinibacter sp. TaxID=1903157 RepID=UPI002ED50507